MDYPSLFVPSRVVKLTYTKTKTRKEINPKLGSLYRKAMHIQICIYQIKRKMSLCRDGTVNTDGKEVLNSKWIRGGETSKAVVELAVEIEIGIRERR